MKKTQEESHTLNSSYYNLLFGYLRKQILLFEKKDVKNIKDKKYSIIINRIKKHITWIVFNGFVMGFSHINK